MPKFLILCENLYIYNVVILNYILPHSTLIWVSFDELKEIWVFTVMEFDCNVLQGTSLKGRRTASRESMNVGEAVLLPCNSPPRPSSRPSTTPTSSNFEISSSSYESSSQSITGTVNLISMCPGIPDLGCYHV